ncbi:MAG: endonuclease/exonuclease/phosphatase family protein [Bacteroidota bacterium]
MKYPIHLLAVLLLYSCHKTPSGKQEEELDQSIQFKVAAYNVEVSRNATAGEIGQELKLFNFDIVCFSEAPGGDWTKEVADILELDHVVLGRYTTAGHDDKFKTIASRTPLYGYEEVLMADTLHTVTKARTKIGGKEITIYAVHFPFGWRDQAHIDETTGKVTAFIDHLKAHPDEISVVMGDFNFIPTYMEKIDDPYPSSRNQYYEMFVNIGLDVTWKELGIDYTKLNSHNAFKPEDVGSGKVIDHIMYNPEKLSAFDGQIIEMEKPLSDHKPVWALFKFK